MPRNLGSTQCLFCPSRPVALEGPRPVTREDAGVYYDEFRGMAVARARCFICWAEYLLWLGSIPGRVSQSDQDMCFFNSFDEEPDIDDLPLKITGTSWHRYWESRFPEKVAKVSTRRRAEIELEMLALEVLET